MTSLMIENISEATPAVQIEMLTVSDVQVSPPRDLSGKDDAKTVSDKAFMFPTKAIAGKLRSCAHH